MTGIFTASSKVRAPSFAVTACSANAALPTETLFSLANCSSWVFFSVVWVMTEPFTALLERMLLTASVSFLLNASLR